MENSNIAALATVQGFNYPAHIMDEEVSEIVAKSKDLIDEYNRVGMYKKAKKCVIEAKVAIITLLCQKNKMLFFKSEVGDFGDNFTGKRRLVAKRTNGEAYVSYRGEFTQYYSDVMQFKKVPMKKFDGDVPENILRNLPDNTADDAVIFKAVGRKDPILAIPIKIAGLRGKRYIGVYKWE